MVSTTMDIPSQITVWDIGNRTVEIKMDEYFSIKGQITFTPLRISILHVLKIEKIGIQFVELEFEYNRVKLTISQE